MKEKISEKLKESLLANSLIKEKEKKINNKNKIEKKDNFTIADNIYNRERAKSEVKYNKNKIEHKDSTSLDSSNQILNYKIFVPENLYNNTLQKKNYKDKYEEYYSHKNSSNLNDYFPEAYNKKLKSPKKNYKKTTSYI